MIEVIDKELNGTMEFYSHFSDDNHQDVSTTHALMIIMLTELRKTNQLKERCTV